MTCLACGAECGESRYCTECGAKRNDIIRKVKGFPEAIRVTAERLMLCIKDSAEPSDKRLGNGKLSITALDDVIIEGDLDELSDAQIYSTGSVMLAPTNKMFNLEFYYCGCLVQSAPFYSTAALRREWGDVKNISLYTDYYKYTVSENKLSPTKMKSISREPVYIARCRNIFYVYTSNKTEGYISIDGETWPEGSIVEFPLNVDVAIGSNASFRITR